MKIGVVGNGYVGSAMVRTLLRKHEVVTYDPKDNGLDRSSLYGAKALVICVPTPSGEGGRCDVSLVEEAIKQAEPDTDHILIKSTVAPGTTSRLDCVSGPRICFSPEYIGSEPTWPSEVDTVDSAKHGWMTIGGGREATSFWVDVFMPCLGPTTRFYQCDSLEAELAKYMENSFLATKVTFCNEWACIAETFGVDYNRLRELWLADPRMGRSHTAVFPGELGWGGRCLPKDLDAIIHASDRRGFASHLLHVLRMINKTHRLGL